VPRGFQADRHRLGEFSQGCGQLVEPGSAVSKGESRLEDLAFVIHYGSSVLVLGDINPAEVHLVSSSLEVLK
jgi:hypothetical protein